MASSFCFTSAADQGGPINSISALVNCSTGYQSKITSSSASMNCSPPRNDMKTLFSIALFTLTGASAEEIFIRANQVGYAPTMAKSAIAFSHQSLPKTFAVVNATSGKICFTNTPRAVTGVTWGHFTHHVELDFSALTDAGRYVLQLGDAKSFPFTIEAKVNAELPGDLLKFMQQQRCGFNPWLNTNCHQADGRTVFGPATNGTSLDARGGWHDAGDLLKYLLT